MKKSLLIPFFLFTSFVFAQDWAPFKVSDTLIQYKDDSISLVSVGPVIFFDAHAIQSLSVKSSSTQANQTIIIFEKGYPLAAMGYFAWQLYHSNYPLIKGRLLGDSLFVTSDSSIFKTIDSSGFSLSFPHSYALHQTWKLGQSETHTIMATTDSLYNSTIVGLGTDSFAQVSLTIFNSLNQRDTSHNFDQIKLVVSKNNGLIKTVDFCYLDTFATITYEKYPLSNHAFTNNDYHLLTVGDEYHFTTRKSPFIVYEARKHISKIIRDTTIGNLRTIITEDRWKDINQPYNTGIDTSTNTFDIRTIRHNKKSMIINDSITTNSVGLSQTLFHIDNHNLSNLLEYKTQYYINRYQYNSSLNAVNFIPFEYSYYNYGPIGFPYSTEEYKSFPAGPETYTTIQEYIKKGNQTWGKPFTFTVGLNENTVLANKVSLYPNPARSIVQLQTDIKVTNVRIFSANGQLLDELVNTKRIALDNLQSGMYLLRITTNEGSITKRLVIE